jgi:hypothetical protein
VVLTENTPLQEVLACLVAAVAAAVLIPVVPSQVVEVATVMSGLNTTPPERKEIITNGKLLQP